MKKTVTIQIGNSDDKLTQKQWSRFVEQVNFSVNWHAAEIHFSGSPAACSPWQNHCWVFQIKAGAKNDLLRHLKTHAKRFNQDSIAVTVGETQFITP